MKNACVLALGAAALVIALPVGAQGPRQHGPEQITRAQVLTMADRHFAMGDLNKDGRITREEMQQARQQFAQSRGGKAVAKRQGQKDAQRPHHGGMDMGMMSMGFGADGAMTREEARAMALRHFDHMDANKDGTVTRAERQAVMQQMRGMKGHQGHGMSGHKNHGQ